MTWFLSQFDIWDKLTESEKAFVREHTVVAAAFYFDKQEAEAETAVRFGGNFKNDESDAFRHALWNALMAFDQGAELAKQLADAHEDRPDNPIDEMNMDLHNNEMGRTIGVGATATGMPESSLADQVQTALDSGELMVLEPAG